MYQNKKIALIVLGAPGSGVHLLGSCLSLLSLPSVTTKANSSGIIDPGQINQLLFQHLNLNAYSPGSLPDNWHQTKAAEDAKRRIQVLVSAAWKEPDTLHIADPFLCRFFALWQEVLEELGIEIRIVHILRHSWENARSFSRKNSTDLNQGHLIWVQYLRETINACKLHSYVTLTLDQLLADPVSSMASISQGLSTDYPLSLQSSGYALLDHVSPELKQIHAGDAPEAELAEFDAYCRMYNAFRSDSGTPALEKIFAPSEEHGMLPQVIPGKKEPDPLSRFYFPEKSGHFHEVSEVMPIDKWHRIYLEVPRPELLFSSPISFSPLNRRGRLRISAIKLLNRATDNVLWEAITPQDCDVLQVHGTSLRLPDKEGLVLLSTGQDPKITLPCLQLPDCPMSLEVWAKVDKEISLNGLEQEDIFKLFSTLLNSGRFVEADFLFEISGSMDLVPTRDRQIINTLIRLWVETDRLLPAQELYINAMKADVQNLLSPKEVGRPLEQQGFLEEAQELYQTGTQYFEHRIDSWTGWARVLQNLNQQSEALEVLNQAAEKFPKRPELRLDLGLLQLQMNNRQDALESFKKVQMTDNDLPLWVSRAISALSRNMVDLNGIVLFVPPDVVSPNILQSLIKGGYEGQELQFSKRLIEPGDRILELGGGMGYVCTYIKKYFRDVEICTVEANPVLIPLIRENLRLNECSASVVYGLASDKEGETDINMAVDFWASSVKEIQPEHSVESVPTVDTNRLIKEFQPNMLIIDIEGGEVDLMPKLNLNAITKIIIELHPRIIGMSGENQVLKLLHEMSFMHDVKNSSNSVYTFVRNQ